MTESKGTAIEVEGLRKSFGAQRVLNGIHFRVRQGETLSVLGRSGTGKSVLLKLIVGLLKPDSGTISIHGRDITRASVDELNEVRKTIGFLFQMAALYDSLTIEENVAFPLRRHKRLGTSERRDRVEELLKNVGMEEHRKKLPAQVSGGMQKRVGLARALALDPDILLFDEPTTGLDPITSGEIEELILSIRQKNKTASVVVTHDMHAARAISDRLALVDEGNILAEGTYEELEESRDEFVVQFLGQRA